MFNPLEQGDIQAIDRGDRLQPFIGPMPNESIGGKGIDRRGHGRSEARQGVGDGRQDGQERMLIGRHGA